MCQIVGTWRTYVHRDYGGFIVKLRTQVLQNRHIRGKCRPLQNELCEVLLECLLVSCPCDRYLLPSGKRNVGAQVIWAPHFRPETQLTDAALGVIACHAHHVCKRLSFLRRCPNALFDSYLVYRDFVLLPDHNVEAPL
ncbi:hypothetical protein MRX96_045825 [Rhipicephalus microplus]